MARSSDIHEARTAAVVRAGRRAARAALVLVLFSCAFAPSALAGPPSHARLEALDITGLNHACGTAVDSEGDVYASSAGESKVKIFDAGHNLLTSVVDTHEPCAVAVNGKGQLFVSESETGDVVRYTPNAYPFTGVPTYGAATVIDSSGTAAGISVDPVDERLYVAEGNRVDSYNPDGSLGISEVQRFSASGTSGTYRLAMPGEGGGGRNEVQAIFHNAQVNGGTFTLSFEGQTTAPLPYNATPGELQGALEALPAIGPASVSVTGSPVGNRGWWVEFVGALGNTDVPLISGDGQALSGFGNWSNEIVVRALSDISSPLTLEASNAEIQAALEALESIGAGNVSVTNGPGKYSHVVSFDDALASTDVPAFTVDTSALVTAETFAWDVQELVKGFDGHIGQGEFADATGVAAYTYGSGEKPDRYLDVADSGADEVMVLGGHEFRALKPRRTIAGPKPGEDFGFGPAGAYLGVDRGNAGAEGKCASIVEQACTAGHFFVYDDAHHVVDEFEASGEFLDQIADPALADASPSAIAVDRSGGATDGTIYATVGAAAAARVLAFGPLVSPSRPHLDPPLSHKLPGINHIAVDSHGYVYASAGPEVRVYDSAGSEVTKFADNGHPQQLAVDSEGRVYIDDSEENGNKRTVTYYTPSSYPPGPGTTFTRHEPPLAVTSGGHDPSALAIDPANDHVYILVKGNEESHVLLLDSAAPGHDSTVLDDHFASTLVLGSVYPDSATEIAVYGRNGNLYSAAAGFGTGIAFILDSSGSEVLARIDGRGGPNELLPPGSPALAVDQSNGHLLLFNGNYKSVREYDAAGGFVAEFGTFAKVSRPAGIAVDNSGGVADGNVYVAFEDTAPGGTDVTAFGPLFYGEPPQALTGVADGVTPSGATLEGSVDPRGFLLEKCTFEWGLAGNPYEHAEACAETPAEIGHGSGPVPVHRDLTGISPGTTRYRFRLRASNKYGESVGDEGLLGPPTAEAKPALPVLYTEATLRGLVDPSGLPTRYHFDYVDQPGYEEQGGFEGPHTQHTAEVELAPGAPSEISAALTALAEGTSYRFRLVAENEAATVSAEGPAQVFTTLERASPQSCPNATYRTGFSAALPDCRAYELVTPAETGGNSPQASPAGDAGRKFNNWLVTPYPAAGSEQAVSFYVDGTLPGYPGTGLPHDGYVAHRSAAGESHPSAGWVTELAGPTYAQAGGAGPGPDGVAADQRYALWDLGPVEFFEGTLPDGTYLRTPGTAADSPCNPEPLQADFELVGCGLLGTDPEALDRYVSPGGEHVIFVSKQHLVAVAPPQPREAIYDRAAGVPSSEVVSTPPPGASPGVEAEFEASDAAYVAATPDGSAVVFKLGGALYLHRAGVTTEVAAAPNAFAGISDDGRSVFYAAASSGEAQAGIFRCEVEAGPCAGPGAQSPTQIAAEGIFVNVSGDGSHAYFSSEEALTGGEENEAGEVAEGGRSNLYAWTAAETNFIGQLDQQDFQSFDGNTAMYLQRWTKAISADIGRGRAYAPVRSTSDGGVFVFQSHARLTAYDNEGRGEIYRYDASASSGERLLCLSCDPSGAPPSADALLERPSRTELSTPIQETTVIPNITDDGLSVVFESRDRLLPEDANEGIDIYEWRAKGSGGCARAGGCLALISSGQGDTPNYLYGMSADGRDVFFRTGQKLIGSDIPGSPSIYDARAGGGIPATVPPAPCQGDACQGNGSEPPQLSAPATTGSGEEPPRQRCSNGKIRRHGHCTKRQHKHKRKHHRAKHHRGGRR